MNKKISPLLIVFLIILLFMTYNISRKYLLNSSNQIIKDSGSIDQLNSLDLQIGIFYDERYSEPWNFQSQILANSLNQSLRSYNLTVFVLNATSLRSFMENNPTGLIIITMGVAPETVWNGSDSSFIEKWLDNGGIIIWTGCQEFYWVGHKSGENVPIGDIGASYVLDMDYLETFSNQVMNPTQLGIDLILNLSSHSTDIFSSISALTASNVYFEVYAKKGDLADPVLFQPRGGSGYFVRIHADFNNQLSLKNLSTWISSFLYNRFFKIPILSGINPVNSIYLSTSKHLPINITNFSGNFGSISINSTSSGFSPQYSSLIINPLETRSFKINITPLITARFQSYDFTINIFCNYTDYQNTSKILRIFSKTFNISVLNPISVEIQDINEVIYPGGTYRLTGVIHKYINKSISIDIILIGVGLINELKTRSILEKNQTELDIIFTIQLMANPGSYKLLIRVYHENFVLSSANLSIEVQTIFRNPFIIFLLGIISLIGLALLGAYWFNKRKKRAVRSEISLKK